MYSSSLEVMALWTMIYGYLFYHPLTNWGIIALTYCVVMDFSQCGNFLLEVFQDWVYQYFMEAHNNVVCFVFDIPHQKFSTSWQIF